MLSPFQPHFNSTMVRLKAACDVLDVAREVFQFHYGTIKRSSANASSNNVAEFQFHYGTIKSLGGIYFTSNVLDFNSTMVRLKVIILNYLCLRNKFQFHYGTIKRILPLN